jgi:hypothetical protein
LVTAGATGKKANPAAIFLRKHPYRPRVNDFIDAAKSNAALNCGARTGHEAAVAGHLATLLYRNEKRFYRDQGNGRTVTWSLNPWDRIRFACSKRAR